MKVCERVVNCGMSDPHAASTLTHLPRPALPAQLTAETLAQAEALVWRTLERACKDRHHGMHTPGLVTMGTSGFPNPRTVVLRRVDAQQRTIMCHTDVRSEKIPEIAKHAQVAWLFYDPQTRIQFRISATARVERDTPLADEQWRRSSVSSRRCYLADVAPGTITQTMHSNVPENLRERNPSIEESEAGRRNFAVVVTTALHADVLELAAEGHRRVVFSFGGTPQWAAV